MLFIIYYHTNNMKMYRDKHYKYRMRTPYLGIRHEDNLHKNKDIYIIWYDDKTNKPIEYPSGYNITWVGFGVNYDCNVLPNLPETTVTLDLPYTYNNPIDPTILPKTLRRIRFGTCFHQSIDNLPDYITTLLFTKDYMEEINKFPNDLTTLAISICRDKLIPLMPNLQKIIMYGRMDDKFNKDMVHLICMHHILYFELYNQCNDRLIKPYYDWLKNRTYVNVYNLRIKQQPFYCDLL